MVVMTAVDGTAVLVLATLLGWVGGFIAVMMRPSVASGIGAVVLAAAAAGLVLVAFLRTVPLQRIADRLAEGRDPGGDGTEGLAGAAADMLRSRTPWVIALGVASGFVVGWYSSNVAVVVLGLLVPGGLAAYVIWDYGRFVRTAR
jgi:hypothetical protein